MVDGGRSIPPSAPKTRILGVDFFSGSLDEACRHAAGGGLLTAPSGPGLSRDLLCEPAYRQALEASDTVLTDSGFMVMLWWIRTGRRLPRNSGLSFLRAWLDRPATRQPRSTLWVMPNLGEARRTQDWLEANGYPVDADDFYVAPTYGHGKITDEELLQRIESRRPDAVYLGIGGGVQERLGHSLRDELTYRPAILCLGAAIAFITGAQVGIEPWVDRHGLGWLRRIGSNPPRYTGRYVRATRLLWLVLRHGAGAPPFARGVQGESPADPADRRNLRR